MRNVAAPIAWLGGVAFVIGLAPPLWLGIPGSYNDDNCRTVFDDAWRDERSSCHDRMLEWMAWEAGIAVVALLASAVWFVARRRDTSRPPWAL